MEVRDKHLRLGMEVRFSNVSSLGGVHGEGSCPLLLLFCCKRQARHATW